MNKITQEQVRNGYRSGVVQLTVDPNMESGTAVPGHENRASIVHGLDGSPVAGLQFAEWVVPHLD